MLFALLAQLAIAENGIISLLQPTNRHGSATNLNLTRDLIREHKKRFALIVVGQQDRAIMKSKFEKVVKPVLEAGWEVDVFTAFVRSAAQVGTDWNPIEGMVPSPDFNSDLELWNQTLADAGARLAHFELMDAPDVTIKRDPPRLTLYPPHNNSVGANAIRRYYKLEKVAWKVLKMEENEGIKYSFVLSSKDDDQWLAPFDLSNFAMDSHEKKHMYDKDCASWDGVNDKSLLFGRYAFEAVLPHIYSQFWDPEPSLATYNSETFTKAFLALKNVTPIPVPFSKLPTLDTVYVYSNKTDHEGELELCQKDRQPKWCLQDDSDFVEHLNTTVPSIEGLDNLNLCPYPDPA